MSALSDQQSKRRTMRISQAKERIAVARRYLSTRPQATGSHELRNLVDAATGLIEELSIGDTKA